MFYYFIKDFDINNRSTMMKWVVDQTRSMELYWGGGVSHYDSFLHFYVKEYFDLIGTMGSVQFLKLNV